MIHHRIGWVAAPAALLLLIACSETEAPRLERDASVDGRADGTTGRQDGEAGGEALQVELVKKGTPTWKPVGFQQYSHLFGTAASGYVEGLKVQMKVLENHAYMPTQAVLGPKIPHPPPYDVELEQGVKRAGLVSKRTFGVQEFTSPSGVTFDLVIAPIDGQAPTGSTPDYASGPIMEHALFPMPLGDRFTREGVALDQGGTVYGPLSSLIPPVAGDGYSHIHLAWGMNTEDLVAGMLAAGSYQLRLQLTDARGNGWTVTTSFSVK